MRMGNVGQQFQPLQTRLLKPGETQRIELVFRVEDMASYDEKTASYIMEVGDYLVYVGNSVRDVQCVYQHSLSSEKTIKQLSNKMTARKLSMRMCADGSFRELEVTDYAPVDNVDGWPERTPWLS